MSINPDRALNRLKISRGLLNNDPTNANLLARVHNQEAALSDIEKTYPQKLLSHLRRMASSHNTDSKNRTKKQAHDLLKGIPIPVKVGTGNG